MKRLVLLGCLFLALGKIAAQGVFDGYLKGKGKLDIAASLSKNSAKKFDGAPGQTFGTGFESLLVGVFAEYGLTKNLDLIAAGNYVSTSANSGLQDGGLYAKYRFWKAGGPGNFRFHALLGSGIGFPLSDYEPTANGALGTKATTVPGRLILQLEVPFGLFLNLTGGHNWRLDRLDEGDIATVRKLRPGFEPKNPVGHSSFLAKIGFPAKRYYLDGWFEWQMAKGGTDYIPDLPDLPQSYGVSFRQIGGTAYFSDNGRTGFYVSFGKILGGRNVSRATRLTGGVVFKLDLQKK